MIHTDENIEMITQTGSPGVNVPFKLLIRLKGMYEKLHIQFFKRDITQY